MKPRFLAGAACALLCGCASAPPAPQGAPAVHDPDAIQIVRVETVGPEGRVATRCGVKNDRGNSEILAPGVAEVIRSARPLEILCFAPGYRMAMRSLESTGDVIGPAATGVMAGGAVTAVAALPLLTVPVFGPLMYAGAVGGVALIGGAANAADKHAKGKIYSYPPSAVITMVPENASLESTAMLAAAARAPTAIAPAPAPAAAGLTAAPAVPAAPMSAPRSAPLMPIAHEVPVFPPEAMQAGVSDGRVRARLDIDSEGKVTRVHVVEARPEKVFDRAVTETLARWRFGQGAPNRQFDTEIEFRR